jgi:LmbE family N-acetylglucosaminyl deacetylase
VGVVLVLSPHLDDAVLSCPGWIQRLVRQGERVVVATVFTEAGETAGTLYRRRRSEDRRAAKLLGAETVHLGFRDAPFRSPRYRDFFGIVFGRAREYAATRSQVIARLQDLVARQSPDRVLAPMAAGNHVDHRLVRDAALQAAGRSRLSFYEDRPYAFLRAHVAHALGRRISDKPPRFWSSYFRVNYVRRYLGGCSRQEVVDGWAAAETFPPRYALRKVAAVEMDPGELTRAISAIECYRTQIPDLFANRDELHSLYEATPETLYAVERSGSGAAGSPRPDVAYRASRLSPANVRNHRPDADA